MIKIRKGLDIPITGAPDQKISSGPKISTVAIMGEDYVGMKPTLLVKEGDAVKKGQKILEDKKTPGVFFTSPVSGVIKEVNRGERRAFQSVVITNAGDEQIQFAHFKSKAINDISEADARALLQESGLWATLRTRPFSKSPSVDAKTNHIFVTAMDTRPLSADAELILSESMKEFKAGVEVLSKMTGTVFVCTKPESKVDVKGLKNVKHETFAGAHPAGNVGTHIHYLAPVDSKHSVWHMNYQDCIAVGKLFLTGQLSSERVISIAGPVASKPRLVRTIVGANLSELTQGEVQAGVVARVISGSILGGRKAAGTVGYLGRFHLQVALVKEDHSREFLGWHSPGLNKFSLKNVFLSKLIPGKKFAFTTNAAGSHRSIVPIGSYEAVMPGDFLATQLLRFLMAKNTDRAVELGALELDEEDLALCTFVDPCKNEFGPVLRETLNMIEKEG
ncbi:MAG: Na(+)-translocating NADH-quinone reductase subunit A [Bacteriovoracaceae bacterium]|nr:Na(+)-translocating NADH-quinone reductase subunit A [Bacteriovoracaceae bacterium]